MPRVSITVFTVSLMVLAFGCQPSREDDTFLKPYLPTRKEWLEMAAFKAVYENSSGWDVRISAKISLSEDERVFSVLVSTANGEKELTSEEQDAILGTIQIICSDVLKSYNWAEPMHLMVRYTKNIATKES